MMHYHTSFAGLTPFMVLDIWQHNLWLVFECRPINFWAISLILQFRLTFFYLRTLLYFSHLALWPISKFVWSKRHLGVMQMLSYLLNLSVWFSFRHLLWHPLNLCLVSSRWYNIHIYIGQSRLNRSFKRNKIWILQNIRIQNILGLQIFPVTVWSCYHRWSINILAILVPYLITFRIWCNLIPTRIKSGL